MGDERGIRGGYNGIMLEIYDDQGNVLWDRKSKELEESNSGVYYVYMRLDYRHAYIPHTKAMQQRTV
jgi:hypothetical protein